MAYTRGIALDVHVGEFNAYAQEILDPESAVYRFRPDAVVLAVQTRDLAPDLWRGEGTGEGVLARFGDWIAGFRRHSAAALIVHSARGAGCAGGRHPGRPAGRTTRRTPSPESTPDCAPWRRSIAESTSWTTTRWWRATGASDWGDERKWLTVRLPVASANLPHLAAEWLRFVHPLAGKLAKCVAVDLDNTLWGGVIGEDGMDGIRLGAEYPGAAYRELQRALLDLTRRGILLAVCSKNNSGGCAWRRSTSTPACCSGRAISPPCASTGRSKARNLREIAAELNIGLDSRRVPGR